MAGQYSRQQHFRFLKELKLALYKAIQFLPGAVSWAWLAKLVTMPRLSINGVARFAVLRWAGLCGTVTGLYPLGLNFAPACEKCCFDKHLNATTLHSSELWGITPS